MHPRRSSSSPTSFLKHFSGSSQQERVLIIDERVVESSSREKMVLPQHLQAMAASCSKITIVSDNAKAPPLSPWSPLFREERGLPPIRAGGSRISSANGPRRRPESRWDSMPQRKRLNEDIISFPSLAKIRQSGYLQGQDIGYGIPVPDNSDSDDPCSPPSTTSSSSNTCENNEQNNEGTTGRGLNLPRRRESLEVSRDFPNSDSVSLLSQVLSAFDLSDEEDEEGDNFMLPPPPSPPGRFTSPPSPRSRNTPRDARPALSPEQTTTKLGADALSIPVRRASIDSVDFLLSREDLEGFYSDEDGTEHAVPNEEFEHSDEEEDEEETEFYDEDSSSSYLDDSEDSSHHNLKDDCTLVTATTSTTSTTLSTLRSAGPKDMSRK